NTATAAGSSGSFVYRPAWLPPADPTDFPVILLAPVATLFKLYGTLSISVRDESCPFFLPSSQVPSATFSMLYWTVLLSPSLVSLTVHPISIRSQHDYRFLVSIVVGLKSLQEVDLLVYVENEAQLPDEFGECPRFFFACQTSVRKFVARFEDGEIVDEDGLI
ncbi:hypothetical protein BGX23_000511, partial [Mortierella sp. AD031]